ncbi:MAG: DedA family protein, partial [Chloroflexota bacterium]|nr:DedA family protein [Chloroflexota bacterium]
MAWWTDLTALLWWLLDEHGLLVAFVLLFFEEAGVPPLVPGDLIMLLAGVRAAEGKLSLVAAIGVLELATVLGGSVLYWISAWGGCPIIERIGGYVGITPQRLERASASLDRHGERAIILGRLVPGLCVLTAVAAGILGFPYRRFLPALAIGGLLHLLAFVLLGYALGPPALRIAAALHLPFELLASAVLLAALTAWLVRAARRAHANPAVLAPLRDRVHYGVLAGLLGALESMFLVNVLLHLAGLLAYRAPAEALVASGLLGHRSAEVLMLAMTPAFVAIPTLWGAAYGALEPALPGPAWLRGTVFALIPLACSLFIVLPLIGAGALGLHLGAGPLPALGELTRYLAYGLAIGATFPIL